MRENIMVSRKRKLFSALIALTFVVLGACFWENGSSHVLAADESYFYVKKYDDISQYRTGYYNDNKMSGRTRTYPDYPMLTADDQSDKVENYQDWIFAGWFYDEACTQQLNLYETSGSYYAKFVPSDILSIRCQIGADVKVDTDKANLRLVSSVDCEIYRDVGFKVQRGSTTKSYTTNSVYKRINATSENGNDVAYDPTALHENSQFFFTFSLTNIGNKNFGNPFYLCPFWRTGDGTLVYGESRYACIEDGYLHIVNVPVRLNANMQATGGSFTVGYAGDATTSFEYYGYNQGKVFTEVTVADDSNDKAVACTVTEQDAVNIEGLVVNLRFRLTSDTISANSTFAIDNEQFNINGTSTTLNISDFIYRNFPVTYSGEVDTTWYYDPEGDSFGLASAADLYGLAKLVNEDKINFTGKTVYVVADITVNEGDPVSGDWGNTAPTYEWTAIGGGNKDEGARFNGTFDGQMHTIKGIYLNDDDSTSTKEEYHGLFGKTESDSIIKNLRLENSYFKSANDCGWYAKDDEGNWYYYANMGSVVGQLGGNMSTVYSNAILVSENKQVGGLVGRTHARDTSSSNIMDNCWFDGSVTLTQQETVTAREMAGGLVGTVIRGELKMTNCLNTGAVSYACAVPTDREETTEESACKIGVGGLVGGTISAKDNNKSTLTVSDCLNAGTVTAYRGEIPHTYYIGGICGLNNYCVNMGANLYITTKNLQWGMDNADAEDDTSSGGETVVLSDNYNGHIGYYNAHGLGYYSDANSSGKWVTRPMNDNKADGSPALKSFVEEYIDVAWYYDAGDADLVIANALELDGFSDLSKTLDFADKTVYLGDDIIINEGEAAKWVEGTTVPQRDFTPIGKKTAFAGTFDGKYNGVMHTIDGLYIEGASMNNGLFAQVSGEVCNLYLKNSYITSTYDRTGSIIGTLSGTVSNVYSEAYVKSSAAYTGGLVGIFGDVDGTSVSECWFAGTITTSKKYAGGIVGRTGTLSSTVKDCLYTGSIISTYSDSEENAIYTGGIVGAMNADGATGTISIEDCLSSGTVTVTEGATLTDTVIGFSNSVTQITDVYTINTMGNTVSGVGNVSVNAGMTITGQPMWMSESNLTGNNAYLYTQLDLYSNTNTDGVWMARSAGTPVIKALYSGDDTVESFSGQQIHTGWYFNNTIRGKNAAGIEDVCKTYSISNEEDFCGFAWLINNKTTYGINFSGKTVQLADDITFNEGWTATGMSAASYEWTPIGMANDESFAGTFEGNGKTISGLYGNCTANSTYKGMGLFANTTVDATIQNLKISNSYFVNSNTAPVGLSAIVSRGGGTFKQIYIHSDVILVNNAGNDASGYTGGFIGYAKADTVIKECWFAGQVTANSKFNSGFIGHTNSSEVEIKYCLNSGTITRTGGLNKNAGNGGFCGYVGGSTTIDNCLNIGLVSSDKDAADEVGAIVGACNANSSGTITDTYALSGSSSASKTCGVNNSTGNLTNSSVFKENTELYAGSSANLALSASYWTFYAADTPKLTNLIKYLSN